MEGEYAQDPQDETSVSTVQQIRIADFINNVVAQRRSKYMGQFLQDGENGCFVSYFFKK